MLASSLAPLRIPRLPPLRSWCGGRGGVTGAPWTDAAVSEFFQAARQLLAQPEFGAAGEAARARLPAAGEPAGVYTMGQESHQAP